MDRIHLDFQKGFEKVHHGKLLKKLNFHGIGGKVLSWSEIWLQDKKQKERQNSLFQGGEGSTVVSLGSWLWGWFHSTSLRPGEGGRRQNPQIYGD